LDQVLACTESATSEYSTTSQCLSALLGRSGRVKFILNGLRWKKKTNAPISAIRLLPGNSPPLVVINSAATRGGEEIHSRFVSLIVIRSQQEKISQSFILRFWFTTVILHHASPQVYHYCHAVQEKDGSIQTTTGNRR